MTIELTVLIGLVCTVFGAFLGYSNYQRSISKDVAERTTIDTEVLSSIRHINDKLTEINKTLQGHSTKFDNMSERVVILESHAKSVNARLTKIESKGNE